VCFDARTKLLSVVGIVRSLRIQGGKGRHRLFQAVARIKPTHPRSIRRLIALERKRLDASINEEDYRRVRSAV